MCTYIQVVFVLCKCTQCILWMVDLILLCMYLTAEWRREGKDRAIRGVPNLDSILEPI